MKRLVIAAAVVLAAALGAAVPASVANAGVVDDFPVAPVWSVHFTGDPVLLTTSSFQYVGYYDADLNLTVAQRPLSSSTWTFRKFSDIQSNWQTGAHHAIAMQIDSTGRLHIAAAMHVEALKYYRMTSPNDLASFTKFTTMVGSNESQVSYPKFLKDATGKLYFTYRTGGSGDGSQIINSYNPASTSWSRVMSTWFNGSSSNMSAYIEGPTLGPDGLFHIAWVWRNTPDVSTNHDVSYARSADLVNWTTVTGAPITLPITPTTSGVIVDPVGTGGGLMNGYSRVGFDSSNRAIVSYLKYDANGNSQFYSARYESGSWNKVKATNWAYRWPLTGGGAISFDILLNGALVPGPQAGQLAQYFRHTQYGYGRILISATTLQPIAVEPANAIERRWPSSLDQPVTVNPPRPMTVDWISDSGSNDYALRWEHGPVNGDSAVSQPWPAPTMLTVVSLNASRQVFPSGSVARGATVTTSSSYEASGWSAAKLVDGRLFPGFGDAGYSSSSNTGSNHSESVTLDLGAAQTLTGLSLFPASYPAYGLPQSYTIQASTNGSTWATVFSQTNAPLVSEQRDVNFAPTFARYIRVNASSLRPNPLDGNQYRLQLAEIEVFGAKNLAAGKTVTTSSSYETPGWSATRAVNGLTLGGENSGWTSDSQRSVNHSEWITVDLGVSESVRRVDLYPGGSGGNFYPLNFNVQVSQNGTTWTTVATVTNEPIPASFGSYSFAPQSARFVRVLATSLRQWTGDANQYRFQLAELEVRG